MPTRAELDAAYRATCYRMRLDDAIVELRVDRHHPELDDWLVAQGVSRWAWLSAANPGSRQQGDADNARRHAALVERLAGQGWRWTFGESVADAGDWPVENGVLVPGIAAASACALARDYGQNALLIGNCGGPARLVWVDSPSTG